MLYAAEYVLPGQPDKLCDAIADALVEEAACREKRALCGIEVAVHRASVFVTGRIACRGAGRIPIKDVVRECYRAAGYGTDWRPSPQELDVRLNVCLGPLLDGEASFREVSDDQSIVTGYAIDSPGTNFLPPEHWLASRLARRLEALRTGRPDLRLGPDGKLALLFDAGSNALAGFTSSLQQAVGGDEIDLNRAVCTCVAEELERCLEAMPGLDPATRIISRKRSRQLRSWWARRGQRSKRQETGGGCVRTSCPDRRRRIEREGLLQTGPRRCNSRPAAGQSGCDERRRTRVHGHACDCTRRPRVSNCFAGRRRRCPRSQAMGRVDRPVAG